VTRVLIVAVVASIAGNVYLFANRSQAPAPAPAPLEPQQPPAPPPPEPPQTVPRAILDLDRAKLEKRVAEAEAKLETLLPLEEKFERAPSTPENEERLRPFLDKVFHVKAGEVAPYDVECHQAYCRLLPDSFAGEWESDLQRYPERIEWFKELGFSGNRVFMELQPPEHAAGFRLFMQLVTALDESPAVDVCKKQNPQRGMVVLVMRFDPASRHIAVLAFDSLANQPGGICIRRALEEVVAATPVPADVVDLPGEPLRFEVP